MNSEWMPIVVLIATIVRRADVLPAAPAASPPAFVGSREVVLDYDVEPRGAPLAVWLAERGGVPVRVEPRRSLPNQVVVAVATDGAFELRLTSTDCEPPQASPPHVSFIVDTIPPLVQLHGVVVTTHDSTVDLALRLTVMDEHLGPEGVRLFLRAHPDRHWRDAGVLRLNGGCADVSVPRSTGAAVGPGGQPKNVGEVPREGPFGVRVIVTDLAGNQGADETTVVTRDANAPNPWLRPMGAASAARDDGWADSTDWRVAPIVPVIVEAAGERDEGFSDAQSRTGTARLPDELQDLILTGRALLSTGRRDAAFDRFEAAREIAPRDADVLEGLALVELERGRYAESRQWFEPLLKTHPSAPRWLRFGDLEHRAGDTRAAIEAWRRAADLEPFDAGAARDARRRLDLLGPGRRYQSTRLESVRSVPQP